MRRTHPKLNNANKLFSMTLNTIQFINLHFLRPSSIPLYILKKKNLITESTYKTIVKYNQIVFFEFLKREDKKKSKNLL